jgi:hypothetical protein
LKQERVQNAICPRLSKKDEEAFLTQLKQLEEEYNTKGAQVHECVKKHKKEEDCEHLREGLRDLSRRVYDLREDVVKKFPDFVEKEKRWYPIFNFLKRAARFMENASEEEKKTFERLVECEFDPI